MSSAQHNHFSKKKETPLFKEGTTLSKYFTYKKMPLTLKQKIILLTGIIAATVPIILVGLLASIYYYLGIESLFNAQVSTVLQNTVEMSKLYLEEYTNSIRTDLLSLSNQIDKEYHKFANKKEAFNAFLNKQADLLGLSEIILLNKDIIIARTSFSFSLHFEGVPLIELEQASRKQIYVIRNKDNTKVRAIIKLNNVISSFVPGGAYLLVGKYISPEIAEYILKAEMSAYTYAQLRQKVTNIRYKVISIFIALSSLLLILSIIGANKIANFVTKPIKQLIDATMLIKGGEFGVHVPEGNNKDEISILAKAFNNMTHRIHSQHCKLVKVNKTIDDKRKFFETILSELSSGVLALDRKAKIMLCNSAAHKMLANPNMRYISATEIIHEDLHTIFPELAPVLDQYITANDTPAAPKHIEIQRKNQILHLFLRYKRIYNAERKLTSSIITFDDTTELIAAQRFKAWADIARRMAHEIRNPLTPMQLSVEQLQKKFSSQITERKELFDRYLSLINDRIVDIQSIVSGFVNFAATAIPNIKAHNIISIIKEAIFLQQNAHSNIHYKYEFDPVSKVCYTDCDRTQIMQVLVNLLKNAAEAIRSEENSDNQAQKQGVVTVMLVEKPENGVVCVMVQDNGPGIPPALLDVICEPYATTKSTGTGLGLSIVKKIVEEHGSKLLLSSDENGTTVEFDLKLSIPNVHA